MNWINLAERRRQHLCTAVYKCVNKWTNFSFDLVRNMEIHSHNTQRQQDLHFPRVRTNWGKQRFVYHAVNEWDNLNLEQRQSNNLSFFKNSIASSKL